VYLKDKELHGSTVRIMLKSILTIKEGGYEQDICSAGNGAVGGSC
jgi:hypothetical protein